MIRHGHNGFLCPQGDFVELFDRMRRLLDDGPGRAQMAANAAAVDLSDWGAERMYARLHDIYRSTLSAKRNADGVAAVTSALNVRRAS